MREAVQLWFLCPVSALFLLSILTQNRKGFGLQQNGRRGSRSRGVRLLRETERESDQLFACWTAAVYVLICVMYGEDKW